MNHESVEHFNDFHHFSIQFALNLYSLNLRIDQSSDRWSILSSFPSHSPYQWLLDSFALSRYTQLYLTAIRSRTQFPLILSNESKEKRNEENEPKTNVRAIESVNIWHYQMFRSLKWPLQNGVQIQSAIFNAHHSMQIFKNGRTT